MQKVVTINLNGNAFQVDEAGYAALLTYLETADRSLSDNPDRAEIVSDLEQAIADKCRGFIGPHKTVVTASEVERIIAEMGPVDASAGADAPAASAASSSGSEKGQSRSAAPRRLYLIHEGAMLAGVCTGLAAYLRVDVTIVRIVFLLLALVSRGGFFLVYVVLAFVIPPADTSEQRAAAHGEPFNARELIDRAKKQYAGFTGSRALHRRWRREARAWNRQRRAQQWSWGPGWSTTTPAPPAGYAARMASGAMVPVLTIFSVALFGCLAWAIFSLVTTEQLFGRPLPEDVPYWVAILAVVCLYQAVAWPLHAVRRRAAYYSVGDPRYGPLAAWDGALSLTFGILAVWVAYRYIPEVREVIRALPDVWNSFNWTDMAG